MGLLTGLVTLPLAPVRGVVWIAEQLYDQAYEQWGSPQAIRRRLAELEEAQASGEIAEEEAKEIEAELVQWLLDELPVSGGLEV